MTLKNPKTTDVLFFDCEATIHEKGNPFSKSNTLQCVGTLYNGVLEYHSIEHSGLPYHGSLERLRELFAQARLIVGFNLKYDLHWIRRYIPDLHIPPCFDVQLCEFLLSNQRVPYPSLASTCEYYGLAGKLDTVALEYWDHGIDTPNVPEDILKPYCLTDVQRTAEIYEFQLTRLKEQNKEALFRLQCDDLIVLEEMEFNGMSFNSDKSRTAFIESEVQLQKLTEELNSLVERPDLINWNSNHHLSIILFGGYINYPGIREPGVRKTPILRQDYPQLIKPLANTELKNTKGYSNEDLRILNEGRLADKKVAFQRLYYTNESVLRSLKARGKAKKIIDLVLQYAELEKIASTYFKGIPDLIEQYQWEPNIVHGMFNQCVAVTGRLSSSKPNLQNIAASVKFLFENRNGCLLNVDVKALEWVTAVYLSQDAVGIREILDKIDQHSENIIALGLSDVIHDKKLARLIAKIFLFRLIFGGTAYAFANDPDFTAVSTDQSFWESVIEKTYRKYKGLQKWHTLLKQSVVGTSRLVMPTGRTFTYTRTGGQWPVTTILNYPVQGTGADLVSIIRVSLYKRLKKLGLKSLLICTVHDSIMLDAYPEEVPALCKLIDEVFRDVNKNFFKLFKVELNLPLRGEISQGDTWDSLKEIAYAN